MHNSLFYHFLPFAFPCTFHQKLEREKNGGTQKKQRIFLVLSTVFVLCWTFQHVNEYSRCNAINMNIVNIYLSEATANSQERKAKTPNQTSHQPPTAAAAVCRRWSILLVIVFLLNKKYTICCCCYSLLLASYFGWLLVLLLLLLFLVLFFFYWSFWFYLWSSLLSFANL